MLDHILGAYSTGHKLFQKHVRYPGKNTRVPSLKTHEYMSIVRGFCGHTCVSYLPAVDPLPTEYPLPAMDLLHAESLLLPIVDQQSHTSSDVSMEDLTEQRVCYFCYVFHLQRVIAACELTALTMRLLRCSTGA